MLRAVVKVLLLAGFGVGAFFAHYYGEWLFALNVYVVATLAAVLLSRSRQSEFLRDMRAQLVALLKNPSLGICSVDKDGRITAINKSAVKMFGYRGAKQARGLLFSELCNSEVDAQRMAKFIDASFHGGQGTQQFCRDVANRARYFRTTLMPVNSVASRIDELVIAVEDVTDQMESDKALQDRERGYDLATRSSNVGLWDWDLKTDKIFYSERWRTMLGYSQDHRFETPEDWFRRVHPDDQDALQLSIQDHLAGTTEQFECEHRIKMVDGGYKWVLSSGIAARSEDGEVYQLAGSQTDVQARRNAEQRLRHEALHDPLTGLPNRSLFRDRLHTLLRQQSQSAESVFAVLFLDLDRFKVVNDSLGHQAGDQLLNAVAHRLTTCVGDWDTVARLGGDEFTILIEEVQKLSDATGVADRIQKELTRPFFVKGQEVFTSASVGIATWAPSHQRPEDMLRDADAAMYRAKTNGKARYEVFDVEMHTAALGRLKLESELRHAIIRKEFQLHYQPIVDLKSGRINACEALVRWNHPERGLLFPGQFLPTLEEAGLLVELGEWVLRKACSQLAAWRQMGFKDMKVSVNSSPQQYQQRGNLCGLVKEVLFELDLPPESLFLELTEDQAMQDIDQTIATLRDLRTLGIGISLDDFGTGYSSLSYLRRLPITVLKIAREFVADIGKGPQEATIASTILHLAHSLNLKVVAEGVEKRADLQFMVNHGCDAIQGWVFYKAMEADKLTALLSKTPSLDIPEPNETVATGDLLAVAPSTPMELVAVEDPSRPIHVKSGTSDWPKLVGGH